jgi:hypothetical protein
MESRGTLFRFADAAEESGEMGFALAMITKAVLMVPFISTLEEPCRVIKGVTPNHSLSTQSTE